MNRPGILVIGAGLVGSSSAASIASRRLGTVFLYDIAQDLALGRAMDINHFLPSRGSDSYVTGCTRLEDAGPVDIVVITAGLARKAGMTRLDLLKYNEEVVSSLAPRLASLCPDARVLLITNPVDVLTWHFKKLCPGMQVFGLGCSLDMVRFRFLIARAAGVSVDSVAAMVIGAHDDSMIPLVRHATIGGIPMDRLLGADDIAGIITMTRTAGSTIVNLMKEHSGHYAAGEIIAQIVESIAQDRGIVFPVSVCLTGEYGYENICLALPCIVDSTGVRKIIELELSEQEKAALNACALSMARQIDSMKEFSAIDMGKRSDAF
jgi:malate dehydrogenase